MKKIILILSLTSLIVISLKAQSLYSTKSGSITFFSKAPMEDISAKTSEVESKLAPANGQVVFTLLIQGFQFPNQLMEDHFNENYMESSKYPKSTFKGAVTNIQEVNFTREGKYPVKVKGSLTIHGVTKDVETDGTIEIKDGKPIAKTTFNILLKDYNIGGAMIGSKIASSIAITVDCKYE